MAEIDAARGHSVRHFVDPLRQRRACRLFGQIGYPTGDAVTGSVEIVRNSSLPGSLHGVCPASDDNVLIVLNRIGENGVRATRPGDGGVGERGSDERERYGDEAGISVNGES